MNKIKAALRVVDKYSSSRPWRKVANVKMIYDTLKATYPENMATLDIMLSTAVLKNHPELK